LILVLSPINDGASSGKAASIFQSVQDENMKESPKFPPLYHQIVEVLKPSAAFLVGGAVRDLMLGQPIHDLDFALPKDTILYAKKVADQLNGDFYLLDKERQAARVLLKDEQKTRLVIDFTTFQGETIEEDLLTRDFTITSMAMDINKDHQIIDPCQGARDLKDGLIRSTSDQALQEDPLRGLRAVRMAAQLGFLILPDTKDLIRKSGNDLLEVSPERIRDELFRTLEGPNQAAALMALQVLGIYPVVFSGDFTLHQQGVIRVLESFWSLLQEEHNPDTASNWAFGLFVHRLGRYRKETQIHLKQEAVPGRSVYQLSFLSLLVQPPAKDNQDLDLYLLRFSSIMGLLHLSNQETDRLEKSIRAVQAYRNLADHQLSLPPIEVYRYFREFAEAGVDGVFLALALLLAEEDKISLQSSWPNQLDTARHLLEGWWEKRKQWVDPPGLLNGNDLQENLDLDPGPEIGILLEQLREAQVRGEIDSRDEALDYLKKVIQAKDSPE
jgi:tRNA nucleotidyltransferase/poly(A) polymerase